MTAASPATAGTTIIRKPQREVEALVGGALFKTVGAAVQRRALKNSQLAPKQAYLPKCGYTMHYLERAAIPAIHEGKEGADANNTPTILFFHGISQRSEDFAAFVTSLDLDTHIRILVPEQSGHGRDIDRARERPDEYEHPTHETMLESTSEFLDVVEAGNNCNAFGISLGGAVCYYLHNHRPDVIKRSVLVSPAILACVDQNLLNGIQDRTNNFFCFENRDDVKYLMRDLSTGREDAERKKRDPVPKFFLEAIYRMSLEKAPEGHYQGLLSNLLKNAGLTRSGTLGGGPIGHSGTAPTAINPFAASTDVDPDSHRLVIWPEKDCIINCEQGKRYFEVSTTESGGMASASENTEFETVADCGHVFHADGRVILDIIRPRVRAYLMEFDEVS
ncbi:hypothetical protein ACHAXT_001692 [Thalassiosira profunda]